MFSKDSNPWQLVAFLLVGFILGYGTSEFSNGSNSGDNGITVTTTETTEDTAAETEPIEVSVDDDPGLGDPNAPVTIVEFSDFQCFYCRRFYNNTFESLKTNYIDTGLVYLVHRDFPLNDIHPHAQKAAEASECAADQGAFWEMHDLIFDGQNELGSGTVEIPTESLNAYAEELGLDTDTFNTCLDSGEYEEEVLNDLQDGIAYGASATPTFFVNGQKIIGAQSYATFEQVINSILEE